MSESRSRYNPITEESYLFERQCFLPWEFKREESEEQQRLLKSVLKKYAGASSYGRNSFISPLAHVYTDYFEIGENSWIAGGAILRGNIRIGADSSVNSFAHIAGEVTIGNGVRIAGLTSIYGFNHGFDRVDIPIYKQKHTSKGIRIEDGVWIGANSVVLDGVSLGRDTIVAGGSVVTSSIPPLVIAGGNPARILKIRKG